MTPNHGLGNEMNISSQSPTLALNRNRYDVEAIRKDLAQKEFVPGQVLVALVDDVDLSSTLEAHNLSVDSNLGDVALVELPEGSDTAEVLSRLRLDPGVSAADVNEVYTLQEEEDSPPNDLDERQWSLNNQGQTGGTVGADIGAVRAWQRVTGDGPIVAILDTGIDLDHPDLVNNLWTNPGEIPDNGVDDDGNGVVDDVHGYNALDQNGTPEDGHGHGTHVAGVIGAEGNNGEGVVGVNWQAQLMPIKIFSDQGRTTVESIARGVHYAEEMGAAITNNSWGGGYNEVLEKLFEEDSMLHVAAAGNQGRDVDLSPQFPAGFSGEHIVAVAATDHNDEPAGFTNRGRFRVDVAAPGVEIYSTLNDGEYGTKSGTSMATPHVAGAAALIAAAHPDASPAELRHRLVHNSQTKEDLGRISNSGGRIDVGRSLEDDDQAPAIPNDLKIDNLRGEYFDIRWTVPGDDGWCGDPASAFELKVSRDPIRNLSDFEGLPNRTNLPNQLGIGEIYQLEQFRPATAEDLTLHVGLRSIDNVGNKSDLMVKELVIPGLDIIYENNMDSEESGWTGEGTWAQEKAEGRGLVWSDSPGSDYDNDANISLVSQPIDLRGFSAPTMEVDYKVDLAAGDALFVEATEDGESWVGVSQVWSQDDDFRSTKFDLAHLEGKEVQFRFRLQTDGGGTRTGVSVDKIRIIGAAEN